MKTIQFHCLDDWCQEKISSITLMASKQFLMIPIPSSISYMWSFGSILGVCLVVQILSGLFLAMHYQASIVSSFESVILIMNDVNWGWMVRLIHANVASIFFISIYTHIGRGLRYGGYRLMMPWCSGVVALLLLMATAFMGYVLPWGQMSYWGATVITNLLGAVPYLGSCIVEWVWGGFSVGEPTLIRLFSVHFLMPFVLTGVVAVHLMGLHVTGSSNPLGVMEDSDKVSFHPYFLVKDLVGFILLGLGTLFLVFQYPYVFMDPDNFIPANPLNTPPHIQPEWYFLFAYAILRSIPNKLGGVVALVMSIVILVWLPLSSSGNYSSSPMSKVVVSVQVCMFLTLTWLGAEPVEAPFILIGRLASLIYFMVFIWWDWIMKLK